METLNQRFGVGAKKSRSYHYAKNSLLERIIFIAITFIPFLGMLFYENGMVSAWLSKWAGRMMQTGFGIESTVQEMDFIPFFKLRYLSVEGCLPSQQHILIAGIACVVLLLLIFFIGKGRSPLTFFGIISVIILLISAIYFYFWGDKFPYSLTDYASLYMTQQIVSWLAIGFIMSMVLALYSKALIPAIITYYGTLTYCFVLGSLRYLFYLIFLHYASSFYMATLFFTLGVFWDFLFVVCVFSMFSKWLSRRYKKRGDAVWQY